MEKETFYEALNNNISSIKHFKEFKESLKLFIEHINRIFPIETTYILLNKVFNIDINILKGLNKDIDKYIEKSEIIKPFTYHTGGIYKFTNIINPLTKKEIPINSREGKYIILNYIKCIID